MEPLSMTRPARALWLKLETMYANKSNVSRTVRLYEELFACRQGTRTLQSYYGSVDAIFTNLELYQPLVLDLDILRRYRDELRARAFLSGLRPELADMIRGQVLGGSRVLPTEEIFAAALRVQDSLPTSQSSQPVETSALIASGEGSQGVWEEHTFREDPELLSTLQVLREADSPRQRSAGRSSGSLLGPWLPLEARHPRLRPRRRDHPRPLLPRLRERSASRYLPRSWPTFRHHGPPHFVRLQHHQPVLQH